MSAYEHEVKLIAQRALAPVSMTLADLSPDRRDDILDGAAQVLIEFERLRQLRLTDRLAHFTPTDPIFLASGDNSDQSTDAIGPQLGEAIDTYLAAKQPSWTRKTHTIRVRYLGYLHQHFGEDRLLKSIQTSGIRAFRDAVTQLRRNSGKAVRQTFAQKQTDNVSHRISRATVAVVFVPSAVNRRFVCRAGNELRLPHRCLPATVRLGSHLRPALRLIEAKASQIAEPRCGHLSTLPE